MAAQAPPREKDDSYLLPRGASEVERLEEQHQFLTETVGYLIQPGVIRNALGHDVQYYMALEGAKKEGVTAESLAALPGFKELQEEQSANNVQSRTIRIADIATGTGAWLHAIQKQLASLPPSIKVELHGFDISSEQFPKQEQQLNNANISFHIHNVKQPFPAELHGKFDLVHIRYLILALETEQDWQVATQNVKELLRPGGALQWCEVDWHQLTSFARAAAPKLGVLTTGPQDVMLLDSAEGAGDSDDLDAGAGFMSGIMKEFINSQPNRVGNPCGLLGTILPDLGMRDVVVDSVRSDRITKWRYWTSKHLIVVWSRFMEAVVELGRSDLESENVADKVAKMEKYVNMGTYMTYDIRVIVAYQQ